MSDTHKHRCGLHLSQGRDERLDPPLTEAGCGFEWEHERIFLNDDDYSRRHLCPKCGAGPWYTIVLPRTRVIELVVVGFDAQELSLPSPDASFRRR